MMSLDILRNGGENMLPYPANVQNKTSLHHSMHKCTMLRESHQNQMHAERSSTRKRFDLPLLHCCSRSDQHNKVASSTQAEFHNTALLSPARPLQPSGSIRNADAGPMTKGVIIRVTAMVLMNMDITQPGQERQQEQRR